MTRLLITLKQLNVIEYSFLNTLNKERLRLSYFNKLTNEYKNFFLNDYLSEDDK